jgi:hypothetical protein
VQRKSQLKQTQSQLHQPQNKLDDSDLIIDDEITYGRNRKADEYGKLVQSDELSDYVKFRLWLARQLAMRAYEKAHA